MRRWPTCVATLVVLLFGMLGIVIPARGATVAQLDITGGSIELLLQIGSTPAVLIGGDFTQHGVLVMGQYQPLPNIVPPVSVGGHTFSLFTHPGTDTAHPLPAPVGQTVGNTIAVGLHSLFAGISGPWINGALNIGTQAPDLATGSYDPATGAFEIAWAHSYQPSIQLLSIAEFTLNGTASVVPLPPAILLFGSGVIAIFGSGIGIRRRTRYGPSSDDDPGALPHEGEVSPIHESGYILLISRDERLAQDIESWFRRYRYEIDCATDMSEAVTVARRHTPSMVLVDRRQRGWEALRGEPSLLWVPMMTLVPAGMAGHQDALLDLDRGMDGYHVCEDGFRLLVARVRALMRRAAFSAHGQPICRAGDIELDSERFEVTVAGQVVAFPLIQFRILHLLMQSPGRVYRTREIVDHVWGPGYSIGRHTLAVHMFRIRKLLGAQAAQQGSIITVRNVGYKFGPVRPSGDLVVVKSPSPLQRGRMGCRRYPRRLRISRSGRPGGAVRGASDALSVSPCGPSRANCTVS